MSALLVSLFFYNRFDLIRILGKWHACIIINKVTKWKGLREKLLVVT